MAQRRYRKFDPERAPPHPKTSSRAAARAWLRRRPDRRVIRIHMEALGLAKPMKRSVATFAKMSEKRSRFLRDLERLRRDDPDMAGQFIADTREKVLAVTPVKLRLKALGSRPEDVATQNRFTYAAGRIIGRAKATRVEALAAMLMLCASRVVGVRDPMPTEAAAMGVAVGLDAPAKTPEAQARLEDAWVKRLRLAQVRVDEAVALGEKLLAEFGIPD